MRNLQWPRLETKSPANRLSEQRFCEEPTKGGALSARRKLRRALAYLERAKYEQPCPWIADDYCIASGTIRNILSGFENPWDLAFLKYFGKSFKKVLPIFLERERERLAMGPSLADPGEMERFLAIATLPPKKPPQSVPGEKPWTQQNPARGSALRASNIPANSERSSRAS
jgi:hypothetical protein